MPYLIRRPSKPRALSAVLGTLLLGALSCGLAAAPAMADLSAASCSMPALTTPFLSWGDQSSYALAPGESPNQFTGAGWSLTGGASVLSTQLADGARGTVLNLPSGSSASSPSMCVNTDFPVARTMVRNVSGGEGVQFYVAYQGTNTWTNPQNTGQVHGQQSSWTLSDPVNLNDNLSGWQIVKFYFVAGGNPSNPSDFQIYNFYVDPYSKK